MRLGLCHPGAVADLARLLADGRVVTLSRAVHSGPVWSLDFALGDRSFPLLAGAITLAPAAVAGSRRLCPWCRRTSERKVTFDADVRAAPGLLGEERMAALGAECDRLVALGATLVRRHEPAPQ